jgi:hypothetical protein
MISVHGSGRFFFARSVPRTCGVNCGPSEGWGRPTAANLSSSQGQGFYQVFNLSPVISLKCLSLETTVRLC